MNYVLQVVRGRAESNTVKLADGVNTIGRHDDCLIRIRSSQVSRRHCELLEDGEGLIVRDLGSSNGTFVNGKRVLGQQRLADGDVLTVGGVSLRVDVVGAPSAASGTAGHGESGKPSDTAELQAIPADDDVELDDAEFEVAMEDETEHLDLIPLDDEPSPPKPAAKPAKAGAGPAKKQDVEEAPEEAGIAEKPAASADEEAAVAQFLMDLKLDEED